MGVRTSRTAREQKTAHVRLALETARRDRILKQDDVAKAANVSLKTVQRLERGAVLSQDALSRISRVVTSVPEEPASKAEQIGARVRQRRREQGLSLKQVSEGIGVSVAQLSRFERGLTIPSHWRAGPGLPLANIRGWELCNALGFSNDLQGYNYLLGTRHSDWDEVDDVRRWVTPRLRRDWRPK